MTKKTILVVDDSEICLELARDALEEAGYAVVTASSPLGASRLLQRSQASCVVVDVMMPALTGDKLVDILRKATRGTVPILLHSDRPFSELTAMARECGATAAVPKTSDSAVLVREVKRVVGP